MSPDKRVELQHRYNILLSFKSAKDSVMYQLNDSQDIPLANNLKQKKPPMPPKDL